MKNITLALSVMLFASTAFAQSDKVKLTCQDLYQGFANQSLQHGIEIGSNPSKAESLLQAEGAMLQFMTENCVEKKKSVTINQQQVACVEGYKAVAELLINIGVRAASVTSESEADSLKTAAVNAASVYNAACIKTDKKIKFHQQK